MSLSSGPNLGLLENGAFGEQHYAELIRLWRGIDGLVQPTVKSATTTTPPASLVNGDRYLIPASATGAWAGHTNQIARWTTMLATPGWEFYTPHKGWEFAIEDQSSTSGVPTVLIYTGTAWLPLMNKAAGAFLASCSAASTAMTAGVFMKAPLNTMAFDTSSWFDPANNRFNPKIAGIYSLTCRASIVAPASPSRVIAALYINGVIDQVITDFVSNSSGVRSAAGLVVKANGTTDYFELFLQSDQAATLRGGAIETTFGGFLIGLT